MRPRPGARGREGRAGAGREFSFSQAASALLGRPSAGRPSSTRSIYDDLHPCSQLARPLTTATQGPPAAARPQRPHQRPSPRGAQVHARLPDGRVNGTRGGTRGLSAVSPGGRGGAWPGRPLAVQVHGCPAGSLFAPGTPADLRFLWITSPSEAILLLDSHLPLVLLEWT